jgi:hypothetical protein
MNRVIWVCALLFVLWVESLSFTVAQRYTFNIAGVYQKNSLYNAATTTAIADALLDPRFPNVTMRLVLAVDSRGSTISGSITAGIPWSVANLGNSSFPYMAVFGDSTAVTTFGLAMGVGYMNRVLMATQTSGAPLNDKSLYPLSFRTYVNDALVLYIFSYLAKGFNWQRCAFLLTATTLGYGFSEAAWRYFPPPFQMDVFYYRTRAEFKTEAEYNKATDTTLRAIRNAGYTLIFVFGPYPDLGNRVVKANMHVPPYQWVSKNLCDQLAMQDLFKSGNGGWVLGLFCIVPGANMFPRSIDAVPWTRIVAKMSKAYPTPVGNSNGINSLPWGGIDWEGKVASTYDGVFALATVAQQMIDNLVRRGDTTLKNLTREIETRTADYLRNVSYISPVTMAPFHYVNQEAMPFVMIVNPTIRPDGQLIRAENIGYWSDEDKVLHLNQPLIWRDGTTNVPLDHVPVWPNGGPIPISSMSSWLLLMAIAYASCASWTSMAAVLVVFNSLVHGQRHGTIIGPPLRVSKHPIGLCLLGAFLGVLMAGNTFFLVLVNSNWAFDKPAFRSEIGILACLVAFVLATGALVCALGERDTSKFASDRSLAAERSRSRSPPQSSLSKKKEKEKKAPKRDDAKYSLCAYILWDYLVYRFGCSTKKTLGGAVLLLAAHVSFTHMVIGSGMASPGDVAYAGGAASALGALLLCPVCLMFTNSLGPLRASTLTSTKDQILVAGLYGTFAVVHSILCVSDINITFWRDVYDLGRWDDSFLSHTNTVVAVAAGAALCVFVFVFVTVNTNQMSLSTMELLFIQAEQARLKLRRQIHSEHKEAEGVKRITRRLKFYARAINAIRPTFHPMALAQEIVAEFKVEDYQKALRYMKHSAILSPSHHGSIMESSSTTFFERRSTVAMTGGSHGDGSIIISPVAKDPPSPMNDSAAHFLLFSHRALGDDCHNEYLYSCFECIKNQMLIAQQPCSTAYFLVDPLGLELLKDMVTDRAATFSEKERLSASRMLAFYLDCRSALSESGKMGYEEVFKNYLEVRSPHNIALPPKMIAQLYPPTKASLRVVCDGVVDDLVKLLNKHTHTLEARRMFSALWVGERSLMSLLFVPPKSPDEEKSSVHTLTIVP